MVSRRARGPRRPSGPPPPPQRRDTPGLCRHASTFPTPALGSQSRISHARLKLLPPSLPPLILSLSPSISRWQRRDCMRETERKRERGNAALNAKVARVFRALVCHGSLLGSHSCCSAQGCERLARPPALPELAIVRAWPCSLFCFACMSFTCLSFISHSFFGRV